MWLEAIVTGPDLQNLVDQLTPVTVPLGERGQLFFDSPAEVSLVDGRGLRVQCHATLQWPVLGIDVSLTIRSMTLLIVPSIESRDGTQVVVFSPEVDAIDLALLPDIGDTELRAFINRELQKKRTELPWNYQATLEHHFPLSFVPNGALGVRPNGAAVKVAEDAMGLAIGFTATVERTYTAAPGDASRAMTLARSSRAMAKTSFAHDAVLAKYQRRVRWLTAAVALMGGFTVGCLAALRRLA